MNTLQGKKIVLGITGSIAAYKAAVLTRGLIKKGAEVQLHKHLLNYRQLFR